MSQERGWWRGREEDRSARAQPAAVPGTLRPAPLPLTWPASHNRASIVSGYWARRSPAPRLGVGARETQPVFYLSERPRPRSSSAPGLALLRRGAVTRPAGASVQHS